MSRVNGPALLRVAAPQAHDATSIPAWPIGEPRFARRVLRLRNTSAVALGVLWLLAERSIPVPPALTVSLIAGWVSMPLLLTLAPRWPVLRLALVLPSGLVLGGLVAVCAMMTGPSLLQIGWLFVTSGVALGGLMGMWLWFRWLPVPSRLMDPFSSGRRTLISVHVALIIIGAVLVALALGMHMRAHGSHTGSIDTSVPLHVAKGRS